MLHFKSLALAAAMASVATQSLAGGFAPVVVDPEPVVVVEPEAPRSTWGILLPLLLLGALVVIATQDDDDDEDGGVCEPGTDADNDGVDACEDPDDNDPNNPGEEPICEPGTDADNDGVDACDDPDDTDPDVPVAQVF